MLAAVAPSHVAGLLSSKDLILVDPEDALSIEQLLGYCGREVMMVWNDTTVNDLFKEFTKGKKSHLAFVQRRVRKPAARLGGRSARRRRARAGRRRRRRAASPPPPTPTPTPTRHRCRRRPAARRAATTNSSAS